MNIISIIVIVFGLAGVVVSLYLRFTVQSPILKLEDGKIIEIKGLSIQQIINLIFMYLAVLHLIIALVGVNLFLLSS